MTERTLRERFWLWQFNRACDHLGIPGEVRVRLRKLHVIPELYAGRNQPISKERK
jgi:hypothetical protein